jgi:CRISPR-associated protein Cas2
LDILVAYDVNTETRDGRRRLRRVAIVCKDFGQRVQYSVFECKVSEAQYESLRSRLLDVIREDEDSLRIYKLRAPRDDGLECYGLDNYVSYDDPLVF